MLEEEVSKQEKLQAMQGLRDILFFIAAGALIIVSSYVPTGWWIVPFALGIACLGLAAYDLYIHVIHRKVRDYNISHTGNEHKEEKPGGTGTGEEGG